MLYQILLPVMEVLTGFVLIFTLIRVLLWRDTPLFWKKLLIWSGLALLCVGWVVLTLMLVTLSSGIAILILCLITWVAFVWFALCMAGEHEFDGGLRYGWTKNGPGQPWKYFFGSSNEVGVHLFGFNIFCPGFKVITDRFSWNTWSIKVRVEITPGANSTPKEFYRLLKGVDGYIYTQLVNHLKAVNATYHETNGNLQKATRLPFTYMETEPYRQLRLRFSQFKIERQGDTVDVEVIKV